MIVLKKYSHIYFFNGKLENKTFYSGCLSTDLINFSIQLRRYKRPIN